MVPFQQVFMIVSVRLRHYCIGDKADIRKRYSRGVASVHFLSFDIPLKGGAADADAVLRAFSFPLSRANVGDEGSPAKT
ncbi:hypothetical protein BRAS3843_1940019 [Bradyrhizobium sp. STM 3843]|nr:hypothetical protein BRAS3843_1940019 [Bradyrhizobium sp. STM 3843]